MEMSVILGDITTAMMTKLPGIGAEKKLREILPKRILQRERERERDLRHLFLTPLSDFLGIGTRYRGPREGFAWLTGEERRRSEGTQMPRKR